MREFWQQIREETWFKILSNRFVLSIILFTIWMSFLDVNSWLIQRELNTEIEELQTSINYYQEEIAKDEAQLKQLNSSDENLEKFAREQFHLSAPGEEIYLIEIPNQEN